MWQPNHSLGYYRFECGCLCAQRSWDKRYAPWTEAACSWLLAFEQRWWHSGACEYSFLVDLLFYAARVCYRTLRISRTRHEQALVARTARVRRPQASCSSAGNLDTFLLSTPVWLDVDTRRTYDPSCSPCTACNCSAFIVYCG